MHEQYTVRSYTINQALNEFQQNEELQDYLNKKYNEDNLEVIQIIQLPGPYMTIVFRKIVPSIPSI